MWGVLDARNVLDVGNVGAAKDVWDVRMFEDVGMLGCLGCLRMFWDVENVWDVRDVEDVWDVWDV